MLRCFFLLSVIFSLTFNLSAQVVEVAALPANQSVVYGSRTAVFNNEMYLVLQDGGANEVQLYTFDGDLLLPLHLPGDSTIMTSSPMQVYDNLLYLVAEDTLTGDAGFLYRYDGVDFTAVTLPSPDMRVQEYTDFAVYNNLLYFVAYDSLSDGMLFSYDGANFTQVTLPGNYTLDSDYKMAVFQNRLYVVMRNDISGFYGVLFSYNGSSFTKINFPADYNVAPLSNLIEHDGKLNMILENGNMGVYAELFQFNGNNLLPVALPAGFRYSEGFFSMSSFGGNLYMALANPNQGVFNGFFQMHTDSVAQVKFPQGFRMAEGYDIAEYDGKIFPVLQDDLQNKYGRLFRFGDFGVGVENMSSASLNFRTYPNPVTDKLIIELAATSAADVEISLVNQLGKSVWKGRSSGSTIEADLSEVTAGMYFLMIKGSGAAVTVVKQ